MAKPFIPASLKAVAWTLIAFGVFAVGDIVVSATRNELNLNLSVLAIPAGFGLLRRSDGWRKFTVFYLALGLAATGLFLAVALLSPKDLRVDWSWYGVAGRSREMLISTLIVIQAILAWAMHAVTRPATRALFAAGAANAH